MLPRESVDPDLLSRGRLVDMRTPVLPPLFPAGMRHHRAEAVSKNKHGTGLESEPEEQRLLYVDLPDRRGHLSWNLPGDSGQELRVTRVNGVDERLRAVSKAILRLPEEVRVRAAEVAGGYNWRTIAGTARQSAHSFGIAVDLGVEWADYWRWNEPDANGAIPYRNRIPFEIVAAFEREGFIWGGKWYHFDTMHFEYRPELLVERCVARQLPETNSVGPPGRGGRNLTAGTPPASASSTQR